MSLPKRTYKIPLNYNRPDSGDSIRLTSTSKEGEYYLELRPGMASKVNRPITYEQLQLLSGILCDSEMYEIINTLKQVLKDRMYIDCNQLLTQFFSYEKAPAFTRYYIETVDEDGYVVSMADKPNLDS